MIRLSFNASEATVRRTFKYFITDEMFAGLGWTYNSNLRTQNSMLNYT